MRRGKVRKEGVKVIKVRDDQGMDKGFTNNDSEERADFGRNKQEEMTRFSERRLDTIVMRMIEMHR